MTGISINSDINDKPFLCVESIQNPLLVIMKYIMLSMIAVQIYF